MIATRCGKGCPPRCCHCSISAMNSLPSPGSDSGARNAARTAPVVSMAFDVLWVDGRSIVELPWELRDVVVSDPSILDVVVQSSNRAYLVGKQYGQSNAFFFDVNGERIQEETTKDMIFSCAEIISYLSNMITLYPGDLINNGTSGGTGMGTAVRGEQRFLQPGEVVLINGEQGREGVVNAVRDNPDSAGGDRAAAIGG